MEHPEDLEPDDKRSYSPTWISDNYPHFDSLECQFFDDCDFYCASKCKFNEPCYKIKNYQGAKQSVRKIFMDVCENYVEQENLKFQVRLLEHGKGR